MGTLLRKIFSSCRTRRLRPVLAVSSALALLAVGFVVHSPEAHASLHADSHAPDHVCAVTLAAAGFCDLSVETSFAPCLPVLARGMDSPPAVYAWTAPHYWHRPSQAPPVALG